MLKSKFTRVKDNFKAQKIFTDRTEPRTVFRQSIRSLEENPQEIIVYYGKGGIGKTRLLKGLIEESPEIYATVRDYSFHNIFVSLDAYDYSNPVNILMAIRNGIQGDCGLFDYALLQYCSKAKMTVKEIINKNSVLSSPVIKVLNEIISLGTSSICIPTATLSKCLSLIQDLRFRNRYKEEIAELSVLDEFEIFERLPFYLGLCISYAAEQGHVHILFLDSYESLLARTKHGTPSVEREEWLQELFLSSEMLRIVIASRDRFRWEKGDSEWKGYLNQHLLKNLSHEDSRWFLSQVPITDSEIVESIVKNAGGVPLYLDMCVDLYEDSINFGKDFDMTSLQKGEKIIDRYLRHLPDKDIFAVKILSVPKCFSEAFAMDLLKKQNYVYGTDELHALFEKSIILPVEEQRGLWKVDESVRLHMKVQMDSGRKQEILENILDYVIQTTRGSDYLYLGQVLEAVCQEPDLLVPLQEKCIQAVENYANMGFWNEIHILLEPELANKNNHLRALSIFAELIYLRRTGQLQRAEKLAEMNPLGREHLGRWVYMYRYLHIQIRHLLGYYDESLKNYRALADEMALVRNVVPDHVYNIVCMKYADLLYLKGRFDDSLEIVESLLQSERIPLGDQIELFRIKAHIYRFKMQYDEARIIYLSALQIAEKNALEAYMGKLYTNMTEVSCMDDPEEALIWFEKAKEVNQAGDNDIELGKALAAVSVAHTLLGHADQGTALARQSISLAEKTGYQSGRAFGLAALYYSYVRADRQNDAVRTKKELAEQIQKIGVYEYILERVK